MHDIVFDAQYLVLGLGDVYLGAPVATPLDPRHRLVTTKYNPARTWTPENAVGIGGAYMCIYGMEGPGGYQFVGRTTQVWNHCHPRGARSFEPGTPWLLRYFDRISFYPVSAEELLHLRAEMAAGRGDVDIATGEFSLAGYRDFLTATRREHRRVPGAAEPPRSRPNGRPGIWPASSDARAESGTARSVVHLDVAPCSRISATVNIRLKAKMASDKRKPSRHTEVERKFAVVETTVSPSFEGLSVVARVERSPVQHLDAVYFDTPEHALGRPPRHVAPPHRRARTPAGT